MQRTCPRCSWPNDVLVAGRKVCGILSERVDTSRGPVCVIGIGINVGLDEDQLPVSSATSLAIAARELEEVPPSRTRSLPPCWPHLNSMADGRRRAGHDASLAASYAERCDTIGRQVRVLLSEQRNVEGIADRIDEYGRSSSGRAQDRPCTVPATSFIYSPSGVHVSALRAWLSRRNCLVPTSMWSSIPGPTSRR